MTQMQILRQVDPERLAGRTAALGLLLGACLASCSGCSAPKGVGQPAPATEGKDLDGKRFSLADYKGKVVLLDFWGDW